MESETKERIMVDLNEVNQALRALNGLPSDVSIWDVFDVLNKEIQHYKWTSTKYGMCIKEMER